MRERPVSSTSVSVAAFLACFLATFALLATPALTRVPFYTKGEPREALVVQSLAAGDNVILPTRNGNELPSKPLLFHWAGAVVSILDGGVNETTVRVPSLAASLATMTATAVIAWRWAGPATAAASVIVLATSLQWLASSVTARVDMLLAACIACAVLAFAFAYHERRRVPVIAYVAVAAATLTKGPVGLILPVAVVLAFLAVRGDLTYLTMRDLRLLLLAAAAAACWYAAAFIVGGDSFVAKQILKENVYRVLDPDSVEAGHVRPFWYYLPLLLAGCAPWSLFLPCICLAWWKRREELRDGPMLLALVWLAVTVVLFSLAGSKRSVYLLSAYPAAALLIGRAWVALDGDAAANADETTARAPHLLFLAGAGVLALAAALLSLGVLAHMSGLPVPSLLESVLSETDRANLPAALAALHEHRSVTLSWVLVSLVASAAMVRLAAIQRLRAAMACAAVLTMATASFASTTVLPALAQRRSSRTFLAHAGTALPPDAALSFFGGIDYGAVFYRGRPIPTLKRLEDLPQLDGAWLLTWRASLPDLARLAEEQKLVDGTAWAYGVEEVLGDQSSHSSLLLVRIVRRPTDERSGGNGKARSRSGRRAPGERRRNPAS
ncbi:MAG TPA: glycosyltransferase family 39 protein [Candidatus Binatia bacterium]|nr:glycosyltransferase family 39 protein [Candidatus Binatia bacterium]